MIQITRAEAKLLRTVLRKSAPAGTSRTARPPILFHANEQGLHVYAHYPEIVIEWKRAGPNSTDMIVVPGNALDDFEGAFDDTVELTLAAPDALVAAWNDRGMPRRREYATVKPDRLPASLAEPASFVPIDAPLLKALNDAAQSVARGGTRTGLNLMQLRGKTGTIVSTDAKQLLVQRGFRFPWKDDVLVTPLNACGCRELLGLTPVAMARSDTHVCIRVGPWTFHLAIDRHARFPRWEKAVPAFIGKSTTVRLHAEDAAFLKDTLLHRSDKDNDQESLTIDLNGHVAIRRQQEGDHRATEFLLARSQSEGPAVRVASDRQILARAVQLGFSEFHVTTPEVPLVARDRRRLFVWMPYVKSTIIPPSEDAIHVSSVQDLTDVSVPVNRPEPSRSTSMPAPSSNGHPSNRVPEPNGIPAERNLGIADLLNEAETLRTVLADASNRLARILSALKQHRRQSRAMHQAMQSLKQLNLDG